MAHFERSIKIAFDKISGEILKADDIFENKKEAFTVRTQFHKNEIELFCCECEQKLSVSSSKYDRLHFKHQPNASHCILKDGNLTPEEVEQFNNILFSKESQRHKDLKNQIGEKLSKVDGVDINSICIDNKFIIHDNEKRRPDVYCEYYDKKLVFEIQLSDLSLRYIISRYEFYRKHGIFLIWILDNFNIHGQGQLEKDIKYLTKFQNFFKLNEKVDDFQLECDYKFPFLTFENNLIAKWYNKSVSLDQITFNFESYQIFYFNFGLNWVKKEEEQKLKALVLEEIESKIREEKRRLEAQEFESKIRNENRISYAEEKAREIIQLIKNFKKNNYQDYRPISNLINSLDEFELDKLNSILDINEKPALNQWLQNAGKGDNAFIEFILSCTKIDLNVNITGTNGKTNLQEIYQNDSIKKYLVIKPLFKRGYYLTIEDENYLNILYESDNNPVNNPIVYKMCNKLNDRKLIVSLFAHSKLIRIIESARNGKVNGFNLNWIAFANFSIHSCSEYWGYIEVAFKSYGLWEKLIELDLKKTFQKKVESFYLNVPKQKDDFDELFKDLYPELATAPNNLL